MLDVPRHNTTVPQNVRMQNFWRNWPKGFLGKLAIVTFIYLLCSILKRLSQKKIWRVNHEIQSFEILGKIGQKLQGFSY